MGLWQTMGMDSIRLGWTGTLKTEQEPIPTAQGFTSVPPSPRNSFTPEDKENYSIPFATN